MPDTTSYEVVIGLEVHCQLQTTHKLFSSASNVYEAPANTHVEPADFGMPGALPVLNVHAVELAVRAGLALGCTVHSHSAFDRKHYVYPDSPKGYQITQQHHPLCTDGQITLLDASLKPRHTVRIIRIHIEEDAAKSTHLKDCSLLDFNRAGVPLIEIVSAPDLRSAEDATAFLKELHLRVTSLGICSGSLEQGAFRVDVNVSVRPEGSSVLGERVELKNLNSFKFVRDAIQIEADRQIACLDAGESIRHHTRHYDEDTRRTHAMRDKESVADYRFMPDPDLPTLTLTQSMIQTMVESLPELPMARRWRYMDELGVGISDVRTIVDDLARTRYFEEALQALVHTDGATLLASWVVQKWPGLSHPLVTPERAAALIDALTQEVILHSAARQLLEIMSQDPRPVRELISAHELELQSDPAKIQSILEEILASNDQQLADYRAGKTALFGFFMGQAMSMTRGNVDPALVKSLLHQMLGDPE